MLRVISSVGPNVQTILICLPHMFFFNRKCTTLFLSELCKNNCFQESTSLTSQNVICTWVLNSFIIFMCCNLWHLDNPCSCNSVFFVSSFSYGFRSNLQFNFTIFFLYGRLKNRICSLGFWAMMCVNMWCFCLWKHVDVGLFLILVFVLGAWNWLNLSIRWCIFSTCILTSIIICLECFFCREIL